MGGNDGWRDEWVSLWWRSMYRYRIKSLDHTHITHTANTLTQQASQPLQRPSISSIIHTVHTSLSIKVHRHTHQNPLPRLQSRQPSLCIIPKPLPVYLPPNPRPSLKEPTVPKTHSNAPSGAVFPPSSPPSPPAPTALALLVPGTTTAMYRSCSHCCSSRGRS